MEWPRAAISFPPFSEHILTSLSSGLGAAIRRSWPRHFVNVPRIAKSFIGDASAVGGSNWRSPWLSGSSAGCKFSGALIYKRSNRIHPSLFFPRPFFKRPTIYNYFLRAFPNRSLPALIRSFALPVSRRQTRQSLLAFSLPPVFHPGRDSD